MVTGDREMIAEVNFGTRAALFDPVKKYLIDIKANCWRQR